MAEEWGKFKDLIYEIFKVPKEIRDKMPEPKYNQGDIVRFEINDDVKTGEVFIVDKHGTFEQNEESSYDIMVEEENILYKHIRESWIVNEE